MSDQPPWRGAEAVMDESGGWFAQGEETLTMQSHVYRGVLARPHVLGESTAVEKNVTAVRTAGRIKGKHFPGTTRKMIVVIDEIRCPAGPCPSTVLD
jgi:hypothetical protein